jgi:uncharacterized membrane protein YfcA
MLALGLALSVLIGISLGFFGGGGSILTVPLLVYVFGLAPREAIASSLLVVAAASSTGAYQHFRAGHVELRTALVFGAAGMAGAYLGARAGAFVDGELLLLLFAAMMMLTAVAMWRGRRAPAGARSDGSVVGSGERAVGRLLIQGFGVGLFTGLVGAGGGFLIVPALALWAGLPMPAAVGTSLVIIVLNSLAGFSGYLAHVAVDYGFVAAVATAAIAGSFIGSRLATRIDPASLRRGFAGFVLAMAVVIFVRETDAWLAAAKSAAPSSVPQLVFVVFVLLVGIAAGRVSRAGGADPLAERVFSDGAGI